MYNAIKYLYASVTKKSMNVYEAIWRFRLKQIHVKMFFNILSLCDNDAPVELVRIHMIRK